MTSGPSRAIFASAWRTLFKTCAADIVGRTNRPRKRHARRLISAAFLACLTAFAAPAAAKVLVSNIGQSSCCNTGLSSWDEAGAFTTGSNATSYTLTSIDVKFGSGTPGGVSVKLATGLPSATTVVATLTNPASISANANNTFTAPVGTTLSASTTYHVIVEGSSGSVITTAVDAEDSGAATGWSVANTGHARSASSTGAWTANTGGHTLLFRVNGSEGSPPTITVADSALEQSAPPNILKTVQMTFADPDIAADDLEIVASGETPTNPANALTVAVSAVRSDVVESMGYSTTASAAFFKIKTNAALCALDPRPTPPPSKNPFAQPNPNLFKTVFTVTVTDSDGGSASKEFVATTTWESTCVPSFSSASVNGDKLTITFTGDLAAAANLANSAFAVKKTPQGGTEETVALSGTVAPAISGKTVTLTLAAAVDATDGSVKVSYTKPTTDDNNRLEDADGNETASFADQAVTNDTAGPPAISSVAFATTPKHDADGDGTPDTFRRGENIDVTVTWDKDVSWDVSATNAEIRVRLTVGTAAKAATLVTGRATSGTARSLTFRYTVVRADTDADGVAVTPTNAGALVILRNGATLQDASSQAAGLTHTGVSADANRKVDGSLIPDTTAPTVSRAGVNGTALTIAFDETLAAAASLANTAFTVKKTPRGGSAAPVSLSGTPSIAGAVVTLTLASAVVSSDTVTVSYDAPTTGSANKLEDPEGNAVADFADRSVTNFTPSANNPNVSAVAVASNPRLDADSDGTNDTYGAGQNILLDVTWDEAVAWDTSASGAEIRLRLDIGGTTRQAKLVTGSATSGSGTKLRFSYTVVAADADSDGFAARPTNAGDLVILHGGATLKSAASAATNARRRHPGLAAGAGHLVNGGSTAPANRAPVFDGSSNLGSLQAPGSSLVSFRTTTTNGFTDPDGDPLTFAISAPRLDIYKSNTPNHRIQNGNLLMFIMAKSDCQFAHLSPPITTTAGVRGGISNTVTLTATDPDGLSVSVSGTTETHFGKCPEFSSATVKDATLQIVLDENIINNRVPGADEFEVKVGGTAAPLAASNPVSVSDSKITLTLASAVTAGQTVTVSYTPDENALNTDVKAEEAAAVTFTDRTVTNRTGVPEVTSVAVDTATGTTLTLTFDKNLKAMTAEQLEELRFAIFIHNAWSQGVKIPSAGADLIEISGNTVTLHMGGEFEILEALPGRELSVSYRADIAKSFGAALQSTDGVAVESFEDKTVTRTASGALAPVLTAAQVAGATLTLTFDLDLDTNSAPAGNRFHVWASAPGQFALSRRIEGTGAAATVSGKTVTVTLASSLAANDRIWVSYVKGDDAKPLRGASSGPEVAEILDFRLVRGTASGRGGASGLSMRFDGALGRSAPPVVDDFTVQSQGGGGAAAGPIAVQGAGFAADPAGLTLTLGRELVAGERLTVEYRPPRTGAGLQDADGYRIAPFSMKTEVAAGIPAVTGVAIASSPAAGDTYELGETIRVAVTFGEAVDVDTAGGTPRLKIDMDPAEWGEKQAAYESGSGTAELVFVHEVVKPNFSTQGVAVLADSLETNGGTIRSAAGADAELEHTGLAHDPEHKVNWKLSPTPPAVTGVAFSSAPASGDTYELGETIRVAVTFGEAVDVDTAGGTPRLKIDMDPAEWGEKQAAYESGSGTAELVFVHEVVKPNLSTRGVAVLADSLETNGGTIRSASGADAELAHAGLAHDPQHKVDWRPEPADTAPPVPESATVNGSAATVTFDEDLVERDAALDLPLHKFLSITDGEERQHPVRATVSGRTVTMEFGAGGRGARAGRTYTVAYVGVGKALGDAAGNAVASFGVAAENLTLPWLSAETARAKEGVDETLDFEVKLDVAAGGPVMVDYATADGTAKAGEDYTATSGTLTFTAGETSKTVSVPVLDDAHDEGEETVLLRFSNASGATPVGRAAGAGVMGIIENADPLPNAWLSRFGRTASAHAMEAVSERMRGDARQGGATQFTLGGRSLDGLFGPDETEQRQDDNDAEAGPAAARRDLREEAPWERLDRMQAEALARGMGPGNPVGNGMPAGGIPGGDFALGGGFGGASLGQEGFGGDLAAGGFGGAGYDGGGFGGGPGYDDAGDLANGVPDGGGPDYGGYAPDPKATALSAFLRLAEGSDSRAGQGLGVAHGLAGADWRDAIANSSFDYAAEPAPEAEGGFLSGWSAWGRGARTRFDGADGTLSLTGDVVTATLGADARRGRWTGGLALSHSIGEGGYRDGASGGGLLTSTLTSLHPYGGVELNDRVSLWGMLGYGAGELALTPEASGAALETTMENAMAAFGGRGVLLRGAGGLELALVSDAMFTEARSDAAAGLMAGQGAASRARLLLEGAGTVALRNGSELRPTLEAGLRYDGGDAETGAGVELGGGLAWATGRLALKIDARALVAHQDAAYEEWGFSSSLQWLPGADGRGWSADLGSTWGQAMSGVDALWGGENAAGFGSPGGGALPGQRFQAEVGYGLAGPGGEGLWRPFLSAETGAGYRGYRLGFTLGASSRAEAALEIGRRLSAGAQPENAVMLRGTIRF